MILSKEKIYGIIGSILGSILLFLILWFVYMPNMEHEDILDEGVMISFGDAIDGGGNDMTVDEAYTPPVESQTPKVTQKLPTEQDLMTQKTTSTVKVTENNKNKTQKTAQPDLQNQAEQRRIADQKRQQQEAISKVNNEMSGAFGNSGGRGSGTTTGDTRQGNPAGHGVSNGNSWSLNGRDIKGELVKPRYESNDEGKITVSIRVDVNGNVTSASIVAPTTISDASTQKLAKDAALRTKFSSGSGVSMGKITYNYRLN